MKEEMAVAASDGGKCGRQEVSSGKDDGRWRRIREEKERGEREGRDDQKLHKAHWREKLGKVLDASKDVEWNGDMG